MAKTEVYDASSIIVLEGLEAVRKRPGMYIGSVSTRGLNHLIYEIVDNAVDEHLAGYCSHIYVTLEADGSATVEDNGRGIPVGKHEKGISAERLVFTTLHAGGKFDDSAYKTSGGLHGVGSSVVNALSTRLTVQVKNGGRIYEDSYERGNPVTELVDGLLPVVGRTKESGTKINFLPDDTIFDRTRFKEDDIKSRMHETAYLNPELTIVFEDKRKEQTEHIEYHEPDGIIGFIRDMNKSKESICDVIYFKGESEGISVEGALQYINEFHENVMGFCNNIYNSEGGTHLTGFKTAFTNIINTYARDLNILKEKDANFTGTDVRNGMTAVISLKHPDPRFEGRSWTIRTRQRWYPRLRQTSLSAILTGIWISSKMSSAVRKRRRKSVRARSGQKPICSQSRNFPLTPMESWPTASQRTPENAKSLSWREILREEAPRWQGTGPIRRFFLSGAKS